MLEFHEGNTQESEGRTEENQEGMMKLHLLATQWRHYYGAALQT